MMANHSTEFPTGSLDRETFKSFFAVTGKPGNFVYRQGWERIPNNWYRRNLLDPYGVTNFNLDVQKHGLQYPQLLIPGGNTGKVNTFTPLNLTALTRGVYTSKNLVQGNYAACFAFQMSEEATPDLIRGTTDDATTLLAGLAADVSSILSGLNCPQLNGVDKSQYNTYPGYKKSQ